MLYDKRWDKPEIKADPFTLESLIAWLEKQPADQEYDYCCNGHCLLAQYFAAAGFREVFMYTRHFSHADGQSELPFYFNAIAVDCMDTFPWPESKNDFDRTFGAALSRARQVLHG